MLIKKKRGVFSDTPNKIPKIKLDAILRKIRKLNSQLDCPYWGQSNKKDLEGLITRVDKVNRRLYLLEDTVSDWSAFPKASGVHFFYAYIAQGQHDHDCWFLHYNTGGFAARDCAILNNKPWFKYLYYKFL